MYSRPINIILILLSILNILMIFYLFKINNYSNLKIFSFTHKIYLILISSQALLFIIVYFTKINFRINFIVVYFSFILSLGLIEIYYSINDIYKSQKSGFQIYKEFKKIGKVTYPYFRPGYVISDDLNQDNIYPLSSISNTNTIFCNEKERRFYLSDNFGFNNKNTIWNNDIDIALIGDSFTQGSCVDNDNNIANQLAKYNKKNILNLGFSGSGPLVELAILREYAAIFKPKTVLWFYYEGNDQKDDYYLENTYYENYLQPDFSQNLMSKQDEINKLLIKWVDDEANKIQDLENDHFLKKKIKWVIARFKLASLRYNLSTYIKNVFNKNIEKNIEQEVHKNFEKIIIQAKKEVNTWNGEMIFVYLPDWYRYKLKKTESDNFHKKNDVIKIVKKHDIKTINIEELFSSFSDPLDFYAFKSKHSHYNEAGYNLISKKIHHYINSD